MKNFLFEHEMEKMLENGGYNIFDSEGCIDSVTVFDIAIDELGYASYRLEGEGRFNDTYIFIKEGE